MFYRRWLIIAFAACALVCGCSQFNTNLTTQTTSSTITFITPTNVQTNSSNSNGTPCPSSGTCFTLTVTGSTFNNFAEIQWTNSAGVTTIFPTCSYTVNTTTTSGTTTTTETTCNTPACDITISPPPPDCTTFVSATELQATITAADVATAGTYEVAVRIPGSAVAGASGYTSSGTTELSNQMIFTIGSSPIASPTISSLSPSSLAAGSGAFTLSVTGTGFVSGTNGSLVFWAPSGGSAQQLTPTVNSATSLTVPIPASDVASVGTANVTVSNAASGGGVSTASTFTITGQAAAIAAASSFSAEAEVESEALSAPGVSSSGRYVVYSMASTDGVTEQPGSIQNVFVRDTCQGAAAGCRPATSLVSLGIDGHAGDADSISPSISADGRYVAFVSSADNLIAEDTNGVADVFLRDTCIDAPSGCTPSTQLVSVADNGAPANYASQSAGISASGRYVTFRSQATNLDPAASTASTGFFGIFERDTCIGAPTGCAPSTLLLNLQN